MIHIFAEPTLPAAVQDELRILLDEAFPGFFNGRTHIKQQPHFRIVTHQRGNLITRVELDYRVIRVGAEGVCICGLIDLCVRKHCRGRGIGSRLLEEGEGQARKAGVAFMVLMANRRDIYSRHGLEHVQATKRSATAGAAVAILR
ncbi:GNAT family N-acetyltransferase [Lichenicoccus sp.]|uniref:GNAT family N-acetyltransferase n=1 Tax=Lichenicoccus sp. TaxID=2781899 RepID=UPI003D12E9A8